MNGFFAKSAAELWVSRSGAEKRALLEMMVSNPTLTGRKVAYELKKPFAVLAEIRRRVLGAPRRIRTYDPRIRSPMLYPAELGARRIAIQVRGARAVKINSNPPATGCISTGVRVPPAPNSSSLGRRTLSP
jgi:hypothetical protein